MSFDLAIFDLDGTLVDSLDDLADAMNTVLESFGFPTHPTSPYRRFVGDGIVTLVRRVVPPEVDDDDLLQRCVEHMRKEYSRRHLIKTRPYPGVPELLAAVHGRGLKTAVLSNKPDPATRSLVAALLAGHPFDVVRGARPDVPLKPDPSAALDIAEGLSAQPGHTVYVGDTNTDMQTGVAAGMFPVGVAWGFRPADELRRNGARVILEKPLDLLDLV